MGDIISKLLDLMDESVSLEELHYSKGEEKGKDINLLLERIIDRTYPEKDAKNLKNELSRCSGVPSRSDAERQKKYLGRIKRTIRVIDTILEESELFGFDDFKPLKESKVPKERTETEVQVGSNKIAFWRKKRITE
ncbi:MAG: hypothetical protein MSIBF_05865 [Candidatus Altiarchaeales archaeon IMC4]|nr:MAG: hypothetical protein MSIBF_05865 [Candidatus Altiarchaeales archaeon IMC4]